MHAIQVSGHRPRTRRRLRASDATPVATTLLGLLWLCLVTADVHGFSELNDAQTLVYDQAHLANTATDDVLVYRYRATHGGTAEIEDKATMTIAAETDAERRDVALDFLSDERALNLPTFSGYRGNPVVIAMLEHLAQTMSAETGGGALYFRNRIRDGMAREDAIVERSTMEFDDRRVETASVIFHPFRGDAFLGNRPGYGDARFEIRYSESVPGGVLAVMAMSTAASTASDPEAAPAKASTSQDFHYELILTEPDR